MSQKWKWLVLGSILLNMLLVGVLLGRVSFDLFLPKHGFPPPPPIGMPHPDKHGGYMLQLFLKHSEQNLKLEHQIHDLRQQAHKILLKEPIDTQSYERLMVQLRECFAQQFKLMTVSVLELATELPLEKRKVFIAELAEGARLLPPRPEHH